MALIGQQQTHKHVFESSIWFHRMIDFLMHHQLYERPRLDRLIRMEQIRTAPLADGTQERFSLLVPIAIMDKLLESKSRPSMFYP